jgi:halocyanin domain
MDSFDRRQTLRATGGAISAAVAASTAGTATAQQAYDGWMEDVPNYDGTHDYRGQEEVTVTVGANDGLQFEPAAILVDPETTVMWEWSGEGGAHNIEAPDGPLDSELTDEQGHTYSHTVTESDGPVIQYKCSPHEVVGMKGVVAVGDVNDDLIGSETDGGRTLTDYLVLGAAVLMGAGFFAPLLYVARNQDVPDSR